LGFMLLLGTVVVPAIVLLDGILKEFRLSKAQHRAYEGLLSLGAHYESDNSWPAETVIKKAAGRMLMVEDKHYQFVGSFLGDYHSELQSYFPDEEGIKKFHSSEVDKKIAYGVFSLARSFADHDRLLLAQSIAYLAQILIQTQARYGFWRLNPKATDPRGERIEVSFPQPNDVGLGLPLEKESDEWLALFRAMRHLRESDVVAAKGDIRDVILSKTSMKCIFIFVVLNQWIEFLDQFVADRDKRKAISLRLATLIDALKDEGDIVESLDALVNAKQHLQRLEKEHSLSRPFCTHAHGGILGARE